jgi:hypothetical protein
MRAQLLWLETTTTKTVRKYGQNKTQLGFVKNKRLPFFLTLVILVGCFGGFYSGGQCHFFVMDLSANLTIHMPTKHNNTISILYIYETYLCWSTILNGFFSEFII